MLLIIPQEHLESQINPEPQVLVELRDLVERLVLLVTLEVPELLVLQELPVQMQQPEQVVSLEHLELRVPLQHLELPETQTHPEHLEF